MSRATSHTEGPARNLDSGHSLRTHRHLVTAGIVIVIALAVAMLRLYRLDDMPPGIQNDEGPDGVYALQVLQGEHAVFFPEIGSGRDAVGVYAIALSTALFGRTLLAFHLPVALASVATVFAVFWCGQLLFGRNDESSDTTFWRGLLIGGLGAGLLAVSIAQTFQSRAGLRATYLPLFLTLSLALLWMGWKKRNLWVIAMAGICTGLLPYTYNAARFAPFLFLFFALSFLLPYSDLAKDRVRRAILPSAVFLGAAGLVAAPILVYFARNPEGFFIRSRGVWLFSESQGNALSIFLKNVWEYLLVFGFHGDRLHRYNFAGQPMLNLLEATFFWIGVGVAAWQWRGRPAYRLLLLWLLVLLLPAMLTKDAGYGPNTLRMIGASPAIYLLIGVGLWATFRQIQDRCQASPWLAALFHVRSEAKAAAVVMLVVSAWVLVQGVVTHRTFFHRWAGTPEFYKAYHTEWADAARALNEQKSDAGTVYILPYPTNNEHFQSAHYGFEYLYQGAAPTYIVAATTPHNLAQKIQAKLAADDRFSTVKFVNWNNDIVGGDALAEEHTHSLLGKYGRYLNSVEYNSFQILTYTDVYMDRPWTLFEQLEPLTVHYDGGISLQGFALGQGTEQLSSNQQLDLDRDRSWWVVLQWQTAPGLEAIYSISLRLHDAEGSMVYQQDAVLENFVPSPTNRWQAEELVNTLHILEFPSDLPPGEYDLRLVVYDFETLKPTVELGVWEPESTLARLLLVEAQ